MTFNSASSKVEAKTHRSVIAAFGKDLVLAGRVDVELGRSFNRMQTMRTIADYTGDRPTLEDAAWAVDQAERLVEALRAICTEP